jgi:CheY-like chemotaxis protein
MKEGAIKDSVLNGKRVLAVDDETDVLDGLEEPMPSDAPGCRVDRATPHAAAAQMDAHRYALAVLDITGVDGFDLLRKIAAQGIGGRDADRTYLDPGGAAPAFCRRANAPRRTSS